MIIAVDFDGTVVMHEYPNIGKPVPGALETLRALNQREHQLILWTMRSGSKLLEAAHYLNKNDVQLWGINKNPDQASWTNSPKAYAPLYIDDAALGCPLIHNPNEHRPYVDWKMVRNYLINQGIL